MKLECAEVKECKKMELFSHQKIVRDYLQVESPYRGLLLYHGLGVGKTCAAIAPEGLKHHRQIYILLNKSLKQNFKLELMKCGDEYYRLNNHWVFIDALDLLIHILMYYLNLEFQEVLLSKIKVDG